MCDVGMPVVFVIRIPPLFVYFLALPSLLPSAITIIVYHRVYKWGWPRHTHICNTLQKVK